jgi:hypothetical protein
LSCCTPADPLLGDIATPSSRSFVNSSVADDWSVPDNLIDGGDAADDDDAADDARADVAEAALVVAVGVRAVRARRRMSAAILWRDGMAWRPFEVARRRCGG